MAVTTIEIVIAERRGNDARILQETAEIFAEALGKPRRHSGCTIGDGGERAARFLRTAETAWVGIGVGALDNDEALRRRRSQFFEVCTLGQCSAATRRTECGSQSGGSET
jgi:hypothetical protein